jgi:glucose-1-phosphate cytidylyltransferase
MKVVLFCGGLGMRLREYSDEIPKPMVPIGAHPILWHLMKYYAHFGHKDFILCLGYKGDVIRNYFSNPTEALSEDYILTNGRKLELPRSDIEDWRITFVDTGQASNIGQRLNAVESYLQEETEFMANYADGLTDLDLPRYLDYVHQKNKVASFLCVKPSATFHVVNVRNGGMVDDIRYARESDLWINGGYFVFKRSIFQYIREGEDLVLQPFQRLIQEKQLVAYKYLGFFGFMDTFREKQQFDAMYAAGDTPWQVWKRPHGS